MPCSTPPPRGRNENGNHLRETGVEPGPRISDLLQQACGAQSALCKMGFCLTWRGLWPTFDLIYSKKFRKTFRLDASVRYY